MKKKLPLSTQSNLLIRGEMNNSSETLSERGALLKLATDLYKESLSPEMTKFWAKFLDLHSLENLKYAFENWLRNSSFMPKPHDIEALVNAYNEKQRGDSWTYRAPVRFDASSKMNGWNFEDVYALQLLYAERYQVKIGGDRVRLSDEQWDVLMDEINERRKTAA